MHKKDFWKQQDIKELEKLISNTKDVDKLKHIQAVYLKVSKDMKADDIAKVTGFSTGHIWHIHSIYRKFGSKSFELGKRGGRYHSNISIEQERSMLSKIENMGDCGRILEIGPIKKLYEDIAGKKVHKTVVYRMLARHNWRKITPRPSHPKNNNEAMETFKKTSHVWSKIL